DRRRSIRIRPRASAERGEREGSSGTPRHGYFGGSRSAERNARITSSRLFSLISSSAKSVGRSSASISTGLSLKKLGGAEFFAAAAGRVAGRAAGDTTGAIRGGVVGRVGCAGWRVTCGSAALGARGGDAAGGAGRQAGAAGVATGAAGLVAGAAGFVAGAAGLVAGAGGAGFAGGGAGRGGGLGARLDAG